MNDPAGGAASLDTVAHVIQVALTPVFLLSGVGTLLNVFNLRQSRVADHAEHAAELLGAAAAGTPDSALLRAHLARLRRRMAALDVAVALAAVGGASTCGAAFALFVGALRDATTAWVLFLLFGAALACAVGGLAAFLVDTALAWDGLRTEGPLPHPRSTAPPNPGRQPS